MPGRFHTIPVVIGVALLAASITGCAGRRASLPDAPARPPVLAILPFGNESNTVDAPEIVRKALFEELARRRFALQPLDETAERLRDELGISDGGQLAAVTAADVGGAVGMPNLLYGNVLEWKKVTTGVYNEVTVKVHFRMVDAESGAVVWEQTPVVSRRRINTSTNEIIAGAIGNLLLNPMTPYARQLTREVAGKIPYR